MLIRPPRRTSWRGTRAVGLRRARVDAFRVYAVLFVVLAHSDQAFGQSHDFTVQLLQRILNVLGRAAVPLFLIFAGEHLGPRLLRGRAPGAIWPYVRRLASMFVLASLMYWAWDIARLVRRFGLAVGTEAFMARLPANPVNLVLYGARPHLWFLVVLGLVAIGSAACLARARVRTFAVAAAALYVAGLCIGPYAPVFGLPPNNGSWLEALLQAPLFFAVGVALGVGEAAARRRLAVALVIGGVLLHAIEVSWIADRFGTPPFSVAMVVGTVPYAIGMAMLALAPGATATQHRLSRLGAYVPAVYINHMLFVEAVRPPSGQFHELAVRLVMPVLAVGLAFATAWAWARLRTHLGRRRRGAIPASATP